MRIGCITRHSYPTAQEIRVTKFAETFQKKGHKFYVFCPNNGEQRNKHDFNLCHVITPCLGERNLLARIIFNPLPINPVWVWWLAKQFQKYRLGVVIVRDLRLAIPVFLAARICGIKAILDIGEHYPGMMVVLGKQRIIHHIIRNRRLITWLEAFSVRMADHVWVVVDENKERLKKYSSNISVINNYPVHISNNAKYKVEPTAYSDSGKPVTIFSLGVIDNIRGLDLAINAFSIVAHDLVNVQMKIYGDGFYRKELEKLVKIHGLEKKVLFEGWVPESQKYEIMAEGDIGLILHKVCELTQFTVPNKLFDYMYVGLPIISTHIKPVMRILEREYCGVSVEEQVDAVACRLKELILNLETRKIFSENGFQAVRSRYRWCDEEEKIYKDIGALNAVSV